MFKTSLNADHWHQKRFYLFISFCYGCKKVKKDRVVRSKFPDAVICPLLARQELVDLATLADNTPDCHTSSLDRVKNTDKAFYLIEEDDRQFVVTVTDIYVEIRPLEHPLQGNSFRFNGWSFIKCNYEIEK